MIIDFFCMRAAPYRKHQRANGLQLAAKYKKLTQHQWPTGSQIWRILLVVILSDISVELASSSHLIEWRMHKPCTSVSSHWNLYLLTSSRSKHSNTSSRGACHCFKQDLVYQTLVVLKCATQGSGCTEWKHSFICVSLAKWHTKSSPIG